MRRQNPSQVAPEQALAIRETTPHHRARGLPFSNASRGNRRRRCKAASDQTITVLRDSGIAAQRGAVGAVKRRNSHHLAAAVCHALASIEAEPVGREDRLSLASRPRR
jgi:hypothetical protein